MSYATDHEDAVREHRIGFMETIIEEDGYCGLLVVVRDAMRRVFVAGGHKESFADSMLVQVVNQITHARPEV